MKFKEYINEKIKIYRNENNLNWSIIDTSVTRYAKRVGFTQIGIGILKKFAQAGQAKDMAFYNLYSNERGAERNVDLKSGELLCRYLSRVTVIGDMAPLCILNADKGYVKFMENSDDDYAANDWEYLKWSRPQKFEYLRVTY